MVLSLNGIHINVIRRPKDIDVPIVLTQVSGVDFTLSLVYITGDAQEKGYK